MSTRWYQEKKREHYYKQAKQQGYRARSAYKLKQIHSKYHIFKKGDTVIDLGAAPGGWSQVAQELIGPTGMIIGVDLEPMAPLDNVVFIQGDMTTEQTKEQLTEAMKGTQADVILSDMSPDITGNYTMDQARSVWLCLQAFDVAQHLLKSQGHFICKLFEGEDKKDILNPLQQSFYIVKQFSPQASRKSSSETYLIAKGYKG